MGAVDTAVLPFVTLDRGARAFLVDSASTPGLRYTLRAMGVGGLLVVSCDPCPTSKRATIAGRMTCRHRRAVAAFLADAGLVEEVRGRWRLTAEGRRAPGLGECAHAREDRAVDPDTGVVRRVCRACGREDAVYDPTS